MTYSSGSFILILVLGFVLDLDLGSAITDIEIESVSATEAVKGGVAKLPCDVHTNLPGDRAHLVIWYKELSDSPIYSYDARGRNAEAPLHWANATLRGRTSFRFTDSPAKLTIEGVKDADGGSYRCRVDFKRSPTRHYQVNLTVIIPPQRLTVLDDRGEMVQHYILGPYNEGASVDITCYSSGGRPLPRVTWWQENALLDDTFEAVSERRVRNILHLERLERRHLHTVYTCQASNNNYVAPITSAVTLDLNLRPISVQLEGENVAMSANQSYEISCRAVGSRPPPVISWWKGSVALRNTREKTTSEGNVTISTLKFIPTMEDSGKFLSCRAETPLIPESALEDGWKLIVYHVPVVTLELSSNINVSAITEGMDVFFECNVKSNPWIYRVSWQHNGELMKNRPVEGIMVSNQSLVLQDVSRARSGKYTCIASNQEGDGTSNVVDLQINFAPVCKWAVPAVVEVARYEDARILCEVDTTPPAASYRWLFNTTGGGTAAGAGEVPRDRYTVEAARSVLVYKPFTEADYGSLLCLASNSVGEQRTACVIHVIPAGKPDGLSNCTLVNQTAETVQVECDAGFDGGLPQVFVMEVYDVTSHALVSNVTSRAPWFKVAGLGAGLNFHIVVYAANAKGRSDVTVLTANTVRSEGRLEGFHLHLASTSMLQQLSPLIAIVLGAAGSVVLVVLAVLTALRLKCRRESKPGDSTKHSSESNDSIEKNPDIIPHSNDYQETCIVASESNFLHDPVDYDEEEYPKHEYLKCEVDYVHTKLQPTIPVVDLPHPCRRKESTV
ncbi:hemicentin-1-like isoform X2 [Macrosteles quadrilineatus]|nr:hemicentin-1-like isoform X2 [Macrosteles quadrilineatus]